MGLAVVFVLGSTSAPAYADTEIEGAIYSPAELQVGISLTASALDALSVDASKIDTYMMGQVPAENQPPTETAPDPGPYPDPDFLDEPVPVPGAAADGPTVAAYPIYEILDRWSDKYGATNIIRRGYYDSATDKGFGNDKFYWKHNLTRAAVRTTTKYPRTRYHVSGQKYQYETDVYHVRCTGWGPWRKCKIVDKKVVLVSHDFRLLPDRSSFGVVTAYCKGVVWCPYWVKGALNI
ncbi:hypothetical protein ABZ816_24070 [Actinosynnema sp. NPDC047251]|nr:hypothetical protein [Saccharothrix espanaensis]